MLQKRFLSVWYPFKRYIEALNLFFNPFSIFLQEPSVQRDAFFTHPSTISQSKFISVHLKMARKVTESKFN